jgi:beta-1,4-N-acetylglucosaminyltransferase
VRRLVGEKKTKANPHMMWWEERVLTSVLCVGLIIWVLRALYVLRSIYRHRCQVAASSMQHRRSHPPSKDANKSQKILTETTTERKTFNTLVVLGSGGHTTEMMRLMQSLDRTILSPLTMVVADTDNTSERRLLHADPTFSTCTFVKIPRSREVGQSYLTSIFSTGLAFCKTVGVVARTRPDLVLINGPGTCLPIAYTTLFFRMAGLFQGKLIFVESFCRVQRYDSRIPVSETILWIVP